MRDLDNILDSSHGDSEKDLETAVNECPAREKGTRRLSSRNIRAGDEQKQVETVELRKHASRREIKKKRKKKKKEMSTKG